MLIDISGIIGVPHDWLAPKMFEIIMNPFVPTQNSTL